MQICSNLHKLTKEHQLINLLLHVSTHHTSAYVVYALQHAVGSCTHKHIKEGKTAFKKGGMLNAANASTVLELAGS